MRDNIYDQDNPAFRRKPDPGHTRDPIELSSVYDGEFRKEDTYLDEYRMVRDLQPRNRPAMVGKRWNMDKKYW